MNRHLIALLMAVGVAATAWMSWQSFIADAPTPVRMVAAERGPVEGRLTADGTAAIRSCHSEWVFGAPGARVLAPPAPGTRVNVGDTLMTLIDGSLDATLSQARQSLASAREQVGRACTAGPRARRAPRRLESLLRERVADAARPDQARAAPAADGLDNEACALARRALAEASRVARDAELRRQALTVRAPIGGIVSEVMVAPDAVVAEQPLLRLASDQCLLARARFRPEAEKWIVEASRACIQRPGAAVPMPCTARVGTVIPSPDNTLIVDVTLDALPGGSRVGDPIVVSLPLSSADDAVRVDRKAVSGPDGSPHVWRIDAASGRVHLRAVETGVRGDRYIEIRAGLAAGDRLAISDGAPLAEGRRVTAIEDPSGRQGRAVAPSGEY